MAFIECHFFADSLGLSTSANIILPEETQGQIGLSGKKQSGKHKTLWLLHGLSDDQSIWCRRTSIERYAVKYGFAVVMPNAHRSFYANMKHGLAYWDFLSEELPRKMRAFFPLSDKREDNYVAGLSMGGYGAFKWAFRCPESFAGAASLSGVMDVSKWPDISSAMPDAENVFGAGGACRGTEDDLYFLLEKLKKSGKAIPRLYQCCGTDDDLYQSNVAFRNYVQELGIKLSYEEGPGEHEWGYWDCQIQKVFRWINSRK